MLSRRTAEKLGKFGEAGLGKGAGLTSLFLLLMLLLPPLLLSAYLLRPLCRSLAERA